MQCLSENGILSIIWNKKCALSQNTKNYKKYSLGCETISQSTRKLISMLVLESQPSSILRIMNGYSFQFHWKLRVYCTGLMLNKVLLPDGVINGWSSMQEYGWFSILGVYHLIKYGIFFLKLLVWSYECIALREFLSMLQKFLRTENKNRRIWNEENQMKG